jgi:NADH dehydrogenase [ubiquinone] 1 alpha subcomplex assembly factor 6
MMNRSTVVLSKSLIADYAHCMAVVRQADLSAFLCGLSLPHAVRQSYYAIRALNVELASIPDHTSRPETGLMRLTFWKDTLHSLYQQQLPQLQTQSFEEKSTPQNDTSSPINSATLNSPLVRALQHTIVSYPIPRARFDRLLHHRQSDISRHGAPFESLGAVENHAEGTQAAMLHAALDMLLSRPSSSAPQNLNVASTSTSTSSSKLSPSPRVAAVRGAISHVGQATGLVILLRSVAHHARHRQFYLPLTLTAKYGVSAESVFRGESSSNLREVCFRVADLARAHVDEASTAMAKLSSSSSSSSAPQNEEEPADLEKSARMVLAHGVPVALFLDRLQRADFDVLSPSIAAWNPRVQLQMRLLKYNLWGTF